MVAKTSPFGLKNRRQEDKKTRQNFFRFFPLKMSYIAEQCVALSWLVRELASTGSA